MAEVLGAGHIDNQTDSGSTGDAVGEFQNVAGAEEKESFGVPEKPDTTTKPEISDEERDYMVEAQDMLDANRPLFELFAGKSGLKFKVGTAFRIFTETDLIEIDARWYRDRKATPAQIMWACLHELSHLHDKQADRAGMSAHEQQLYLDAQATGAEMMKKYQDAFGDDPEFMDAIKAKRPLGNPKNGRQLDSVEQAAYSVHHLFSNIFLDHFVNNNVASRAARYDQSGHDNDEVKKLYRDILFKGADYANLPRHMQYVYALLRQEMVPDERVTVSEEVQAVLDSKMSWLGFSKTAAEILEYIKPRAGRDTTVSARDKILASTLKKQFAHLLSLDIADWTPTKPEKPEPKSGEQKAAGEGGEGEKGEEGDSGSSAGFDVNPWADDYKQHQDKTPDQFDENDENDWHDAKDATAAAKAAAEAEREAEGNLTAEQRQAIIANRNQQQWCEQHGISEDVRQRYNERLAEVAPYLNDLAAMWDEIIGRLGHNSETVTDGFYERGTLNVNEAIKQMPQILSGQYDTARVMERQLEQLLPSEKPELIMVRLVGDLSGSMTLERRSMLEKVMVMLMASIRQFNSALNLTRSTHKSKLSANSAVYVFGNNAVCVKPALVSNQPDTELMQIMKAYEVFTKNLGGTHDESAFELIATDFDDERKKAIASGKIVEIVIEITDGGANDVNASRAALDSLIGAKAKVYALQVGSPGEDEVKAFNAVWNEGRGQALGEQIGGSLDQVFPKLVLLLKNVLNKLTI